MSGKQIIIVSVAAILGSLMGAKAMQYIGPHIRPLGSLVPEVWSTRQHEERASAKESEDHQHRREQSPAQEHNTHKDDHDQYKVGEKHGEDHDEG